ncbi:MAG: PAS domain S-box protein, partial [Pseudomonadota bacterium]
MTSLGEDPFDTVYADAPILMHSIDAEGRLINVSRYWAGLLGYTREEMIGRRSSEFLTEESRRYEVVGGAVAAAFGVEPRQHRFDR